MTEIRSCYLCEGLGCSECDNTGQRVVTVIEEPEGIVLRVHGSAPLSKKDRKALAEVAKAVIEALDAAPDEQRYGKHAGSPSGPQQHRHNAEEDDRG